MGKSLTTLLRVRGVSKKYRRGNEITAALTNVSLDIYSGELVAIMGPSGSGKSTLSHIIGGLTSPDEGTITFGEYDLKRQTDKQLSQYRNKKIGFVFQNFGLIPYYSALENVCMPLMIEGVPKHERDMRAERLLKAVGLQKRMYHRAATLSGGERQRVSIARALANSPDVIIADEPTGSLDSKRGGEIMTILTKLVTSHNVTVVMVTHDLSLARRADRIFYLQDGRIAKEARQ